MGRLGLRVFAGGGALRRQSACGAWAEVRFRAYVCRVDLWRALRVRFKFCAPAGVLVAPRLLRSRSAKRSAQQRERNMDSGGRVP